MQGPAPELTRPFGRRGRDVPSSSKARPVSHSIKLPETNPLHFSVPVADIKAIVTGKDCPHMKEKSALKQNKVSPEPEAP